MLLAITYYQGSRCSSEIPWDLIRLVGLRQHAKLKDLINRLGDDLGLFKKALLNFAYSQAHLFCQRSLESMLILPTLLSCQFLHKVLKDCEEL